jgi:hypothetical protein
MVHLKAIVAYNQTGQKVTLSDCQVKQKNEVQDLYRYRDRDRDLFQNGKSNLFSIYLKFFYPRIFIYFVPLYIYIVPLRYSMAL